VTVTPLISCRRCGSSAQSRRRPSDSSLRRCSMCMCSDSLCTRGRRKRHPLSHIRQASASYRIVNARARERYGSWLNIQGLTPQRWRFRAANQSSGPRCVQPVRSRRRDPEAACPRPLVKNDPQTTPGM
jgi:hypothetical protein